MIPDSLSESAAEFTDAGQWKCSWHWKRNHYGRITLEGAEQILRDLQCEDEAREIAQAVRRIRRRYRFARTVRALIAEYHKQRGIELEILDKRLDDPGMIGVLLPEVQKELTP